MNPIHVTVVNESVVPQEEVVDAIAALQAQLDGPFAAVWKIEAVLELTDYECKEPRAQHYGLVLLNSNDQAAERGYHDVTRFGRPLAKVFVKPFYDTKATSGMDWTHTVSHELLDMLCDPYINLVVENWVNLVEPKFFAREVCDPCAPYRVGYKLRGRGQREWQVSDFVYPSWFVPPPQGIRPVLSPYERLPAPTMTPEDKFDETGAIDGPFELVDDGGYIGFYDGASGTWKLRQKHGGKETTRTVPEGPAEEEAKRDVPEVPDEDVTQVSSRMEQRGTVRNRRLWSNWSTAP